MASDVTFDELNELDGEVLPERTAFSASDGILNGGLLNGGLGGISPLLR